MATLIARLRALVAQVDLLFNGAGHTVTHHRHRQLGQVAGSARHNRAIALGAGQCQQLVNRVGGANAGAPNLAQRVLEFFSAGALALGQIGLHAQASQWCFELVRGVG